MAAPAQETAGFASEIAFIERHWTEKWQGAQLGASLSRLERRDEFVSMSPYLRPLSAGARLLDAGCGLGEWTVYFSRKGFDCVGLDISQATIDRLRSYFPAADFRRGDVRETNEPDSSFDAVFSWGVFEHFEEGPQKCLAEAWRVLKPGGLLFITVPFDNLRQALISLRQKRHPPDAKLRFYQWRFTKGELAQELNLAGFEPLGLRLIHKRQGVLRSLHHELGLPLESLPVKALAAGLAPFLPGAVFAHMLFAAARKRPRP